MKQILTILFSLVLVAQTYVPYAYAQTATDSAQLFATGSATLQTASSSGQLLPQNPQQQATFLGVNQLTNTNANTSAIVAQPPVVLSLPQKSYKAEDNVEVTVGNSAPDSVKVKLIDFYGLDATNRFVIQKFANGTQTIIDITPPVSRFKPGKYTLQITDAQGNTSTQDFTWGVLAINTNKSIYLPNETAQIAMAVLDTNGNMVCNADVMLGITDPMGKTTTLTTKNGEIVVNDICTKHEFSLTPDYQTSYTVSGAGKYTMNLSATTKAGTYSISDTFDVANSVDFDVERTTATRLYPPLWYPVTLTIKANKDFSGVITDYVPATFDISPATASAVMSYSQVKTVYPGSNNTFTLFGVSALHLGMPFTGDYPVTQGFGEQLTDPQEKKQYEFYHVLGHDGIDFATPAGTPVLATDDGTVVMSEANGVYGTTIVIRHSWGQSYYGHLSTMEVKVGDHVHKGQEIGLSGSTGMVTGPHLHFGIKPLHPEMENGFFGKVDPAPYLSLNVTDAATWSAQSRLDNQPLKVIQWKVDIKKGDILTIGYQFKAPRVSPEFYTLGPLHFIDNDGNVQFTEARVWQLAADWASLPATIYLSSTASTKLTTTTSWQTVTSAPASANTTTIAQEGRNGTGYTQFAPGATTSTQVTSMPTSGNGKGWIYDTSFDSTIPSGTWQFNIKTTASSAGGVGYIVVCVWDALLVGTNIGTTTSIFNCGSGATNVQASTTPTSQTISVSSLSAYSNVPGHYLYVEYWLDTATKNGSSNSANVALEVNAGSADDIVTPGASSNLSPNAPTLQTPVNNATNTSTTPTIQLTSTDPEGDSEQYKIVIYSSSGCSANIVQTDDQSSSQTGWSGQNATCSVSNDCYTSGQTPTFVVQTPLSNATQYWWNGAAKDPLGSNAFGSSGSCNTFTTIPASTGPTLDQLLRHGQWFNNGAAQPFTF